MLTPIQREELLDIIQADGFKHIKGGFFDREAMRQKIDSYLSTKKQSAVEVDGDVKKIREALKCLEGMTSNRGDDTFVWGAQSALTRLASRLAEKEK